jgi:hypothetical protein
MTRLHFVKEISNTNDGSASSERGQTCVQLGSSERSTFTEDNVLGVSEAQTLNTF